MRTKFISLFLVFSILALSGNLIAKERRGAELIVQKKDGQQVRGELIAVKQNSLLILVSGVDVSVDANDIKVVRIKKSMLPKVIIGLGAGFLTGYALTELNRKSYTGTGFEGLEHLGEAYITLAGCTIAGACVGAVMGIDKKIQIEGKSAEEVKEALEKLRKKARVPEYE